MSRWTFEPGHTEARFRARHMMVAYVEGLFKDVHGHLIWDPEAPGEAACEVTIQADRLWTGEPTRDAHLKSADFFDVEHHPELTFRSTRVTPHSETELTVSGDLSIRGTARPVTLEARLVGQWDTPYWEQKGEEWRDFGPVRRVGFTATVTVNRHDWGVSWQDHVARDGLVVSDRVALRVDAEALRDEDVARAQREIEAWKAR